MSRTLRLLAVLASMVLFITPVLAQQNQKATDAVSTAPQVVKTADSVTGYMVKFFFPNDGYKRVRIEGEWSFSDDIHASSATSLRATPFEWEDGMFAINNARVTYDMKLNQKTNLWEMSLPLPNGTFSYTFYINGKQNAKITDYAEAILAWDPGNPPYGANNEPDREKMTKYSNRYFHSSIYVPRDAEKQKATADHTIEAPRTDGKKGTVQFQRILVNEALGRQPYGMYLPENFDINRFKKYPVVFLIHGGGNDESQWFTAGAAANMLDNLIAERRTEPTIVVTMNGTIQNWDFPNMMLTADAILKHVIENYNVSPEVSRHAFTGLSMGGMTTSYALFSRVESFDYFGIMSGSFGMLVKRAPEVAKFDYGAKILKSKHILLSAAICDPALYNDIIPAQKDFAAAGTPFISKIIQGGHDYAFWNQIFAWQLEHFFWK